MKKLLTLVLLFTAITLTSCGDEITNINNTFVENQEVKLSAEELITSAESPFKSRATFDTSYTHQLPSTYKAYFVADETRGQYTMGQVVKTIDVVGGMNSITIPKLKFKVYVTNYIKPNGNESQPYAWYTYPNAVEQMPQTSHELNLYGFNSIDYSVNTVGTVTVTNPYSAVMIKNNQWISSTPSSYDTNQSYFSANSNWYVLYIRNNNTNTKVPISVPGNPNQNFTLSRTIEPNKIYQYEFNGNVLEDGGGFNVIEVPLEEGLSEVIPL